MSQTTENYDPDQYNWRDFIDRFNHSGRLKTYKTSLWGRIMSRNAKYIGGAIVVAIAIGLYYILG